MKSVQLAILCTYGCSYSSCAHLLQEGSLPTARAKGTRWTEDEVTFIKDTVNDELATVAEVLNRTYYAVALARSKIKRGILKV